MNITIETHALAAQDAATFIAAQRDPALVASAGDAVEAMRRLMNSITTPDLLRRAIGMPNGLQWLKDLGEGAHALQQTLRSEQALAKDVLGADGAMRYRLDGAASERWRRAQKDAQACQAELDAANANYADVRRAMSASGVSESEIEAFVASRQAEFTARNTASRDAAQATIAAIRSFLVDPLRGLDQLGDDLARELSELADGIAARTAQPTIGIDQAVRAGA